MYDECFCDEQYYNAIYLIVMLSISFPSIVKLLTLSRYYELSINNQNKN